MGDTPGWDDVMREFLLESREHVQSIEATVLELEARPGSQPLLAQLFRALHTVKGTCGFLGFSRLEALMHAAEEMLGLARDRRLVLDRERVSTLLAAADAARGARPRAADAPRGRLPGAGRRGGLAPGGGRLHAAPDWTDELVPPHARLVWRRRARGGRAALAPLRRYTLRRMAPGNSVMVQGSRPGVSPSTSRNTSPVSGSAWIVRQRSRRVPFQVTWSPL
ncbi:hypothetical protein GTZ93_08155 [Corallococcus exiguus]|uniref:HPt domain-containing protein n=1 Tax=Corallococcus exiguus TaxID=83462 RepID=A0A7X4Y6Y8_9BACT|nr:hypothetical protein [Corallococcus exiguus]